MKSNTRRAITIAIVLCAAALYTAWRLGTFDAPRPSTPSSAPNDTPTADADSPSTPEGTRTEDVASPDHRVVAVADTKSAVTTATETASATSASPAVARSKAFVSTSRSSWARTL
jgi:hypothetical protein